MGKAYRAYNHEFAEEFDAIDAGMDRFVGLSRDCIGVDTIRKNRQASDRLKLAYLVFDDEIPCEVFCNESVFHNDHHVGMETGGAFGRRVGKSLAFVYVAPKFATQGTILQVETTLGIRTANVEGDCAYDPSNERMRA
jgi:dimethylglycine dehydrogenase